MAGFLLPEGIYGITSEEHSLGRSNAETVLSMLQAGVRIVQYREKGEKSIREKYHECQEIRKMTRDYGAIFIVNDFIDLAMLSDADGVHIGQDDLPVSEVRKWVGEKIIGCSTHSPAQALEAEKEGADYIGIGPVYSTQTKKNAAPTVGLSMVRFASESVGIPWVAIGGIKMRHLPELLAAGVRTAALVTEIVGAENIHARVKEIQAVFSGKRPCV